MTDLILDRFRSDAQGTFGMLAKDGATLCFTCELPWVDNEPMVSCIPPGVYPCMAYSSIAHPDVWIIANVPGRNGILIHNGNTENDSKGCIIIGDKLGKINGLPAVLDSRDTLNMLRLELPNAFTLTINGVPA